VFKIGTHFPGYGIRRQRRMSRSPKAPAATRENSKSSLGTTGGIGLQTSGKMLREMLEKSGARHKLEGAEKLDFLVWLADQVVYCIENRRKMKLRFEELTDFLSRERALPSGDDLDPKAAVSGLLALRTREISRLRYDEDQLKALSDLDANFKLVLAGMPLGRVNNCFDGVIIPYEEGRGSPCSSTLPGQVTSPRCFSDNADGVQTYSVGEMVEYHSASMKSWVTAQVREVNPDGTYDLDCKPHVNIARIRSTTGETLTIDQQRSLRRAGNPTITTDEASQPEISERCASTPQKAGSGVSGRDATGMPPSTRTRSSPSYTLMPGMPPPPCMPPSPVAPSPSAQAASEPAASRKRCLVM